VADIVLKALDITKERAILLADSFDFAPYKAKLQSMIDKNQVFLSSNYTPHSWLFPKMKIIVHHGGCGTTNSVVKAKVPSIIIPILGIEQVFWGKRVEELGLGKIISSIEEVDAQQLATTIQQILKNKASYDINAKKINDVYEWKGAENAAKLMEDYFKLFSETKK